MPPSENPGQVVEGVTIGVGYIPDFLPEDLRLWFEPNVESAVAVYHELVGDAAENWGGYFTKKGWAAAQAGHGGAEGPFRVDPDTLRFEILEPGRVFAPKPFVRVGADGAQVPFVSMEKRRPINPWKPNHIRATNFIKRYEWKEPVPRAVHYAVWEIEECGEVAGSTAWINAERVLVDQMSDAVRGALSDIFFNRLEDFPLGSQVYLRVLGRAGSEGFSELIELSEHPIARKRRFVAAAFGELEDPRGKAPLLKLLDDEDPEVRTAALRALGRVGIGREEAGAEQVEGYMESEEPPKRVWAAQALLRGGDESLQKYFLTLIKEEPRLLTDMGEMGDVLRDLELYEAVPFVINRLKHADAHFRADAAESLEKITGLEIGYHLETPEERRQAIRQCTRWWEDYKKQRRLNKGG